MAIDNWTRFKLILPQTDIECGKLTTRLPTEIVPGTSEMTLFEKGVRFYVPKISVKSQHHFLKDKKILPVFKKFRQITREHTDCCDLTEKNKKYFHFGQFLNFSSSAKIRKEYFLFNRFGVKIQMFTFSAWIYWSLRGSDIPIGVTTRNR